MDKMTVEEQAFLRRIALVPHGGFARGPEQIKMAKKLVALGYFTNEFEMSDGSYNVKVSLVGRDVLWGVKT